MLSPSGSRHGTRTPPTPLTGLLPETMSFRLTLHRLRSAVPYIWGMCSPIPIPTPWLASGVCAVRACFIRWAGTTTDCLQSDAYRTTTACHVMRQLPMLRTSSRRFVVTRQKIIVLFPFRVRISLSCAKNSQQKTKRFSKICSVVLDFQSTGHCCTPPLKTVHVAQASVASCATLLVVRRTHKKHQHCGTLIFAPQLLKQS